MVRRLQRPVPARLESARGLESVLAQVRWQPVPVVELVAVLSSLELAAVPVRERPVPDLERVLALERLLRPVPVRPKPGLREWFREWLQVPVRERRLLGLVRQLQVVL